MNPAGFAVSACFLVGVVIAVAKFIFSHQSHNNHHENQHNHHNESNSRRHPNLTCPYCGQATVANDFPLRCGHLCHVTCFRARSAGTRDNCSFCYDDQDDEVVSGESTSRLHEEVIYRPNRQPPSNNDENDLTAAGPSESTPETPSTIEDVYCAFCRLQLDLLVNKNQLNCGHYAHENCFEKLKHLAKCQECISSDSEDEIYRPSHFVANT